jgi:hypothetical protein
LTEEQVVGAKLIKLYYVITSCTWDIKDEEAGERAYNIIRRVFENKTAEELLRYVPKTKED